MNGENSVEPINILVSRDELLFVLNALEADFIPGLDLAPPGSDLTIEQQSLALAVAGRALRARQLARAQAGGELEIHTALLTMVGVCAYAQHVVFVYHWPSNADAPQRYFGHIRGSDIVTHTQPEDDLHLFSLLPGKSMLLDQILAICHCRGETGPAAFEFLVSNQAFAAAREFAGAGNREQARQALSANGTDAAAAAALIDTLSGSPQVSILQVVTQPDDGKIRKRDITLLQNHQRAWLVMAPEDTANAPLRVKTTTAAELQEMLAAWL